MFELYVETLAKGLEIKYLKYVRTISFLDLWVEWWDEDCTEAIDMFEEFGIDDTEIKAWMFWKGFTQYEQDLMEEFQAALV
jgi:hypothetical protein